eukprot:1143894-Pelagomonas_calceolata.AAC.3
MEIASKLSAVQILVPAAISYDTLYIIMPYEKETMDQDIEHREELAQACVPCDRCSGFAS